MNRNKIFSCLFFLINICFGECDEKEYKLIHNLLKNYDPSIRPSLHHKIGVNVTFGLALTQIIDVVDLLILINLIDWNFYLEFCLVIYDLIFLKIKKDERNMIVTTNCWLTQVIKIIIIIIIYYNYCYFL